MKHYKDSQNNLFGYEVCDIVPAGLTEITMDEVRSIVATKQPALTAEEIAMMRRITYINEADPLFFKAQRGEVEQQAWLDKIAEIKARYPKE
jgi:response regulator of citrate/malate metabolism